MKSSPFSKSEYPASGIRPLPRGLREGAEATLYWQRASVPECGNWPPTVQWGRFLCGMQSCNPTAGRRSCPTCPTPAKSWRRLGCPCSSRAMTGRVQYGASASGAPVWWKSQNRSSPYMRMTCGGTSENRSIRRWTGCGSGTAT